MLHATQILAAAILGAIIVHALRSLWLENDGWWYWQRLRARLQRPSHAALPAESADPVGRTYKTPTGVTLTLIEPESVDSDVRKEA